MTQPYRWLTLFATVGQIKNQTTKTNGKYYHKIFGYTLYYDFNCFRTIIRLILFYTGKTFSAIMHHTFFPCKNELCPCYLTKSSLRHGKSLVNCDFSSWFGFCLFLKEFSVGDWIAENNKNVLLKRQFCIRCDGRTAQFVYSKSKPFRNTIIDNLLSHIFVSYAQKIFTREWICIECFMDSKVNFGSPLVLQIVSN